MLKSKLLIGEFVITSQNYSHSAAQNSLLAERIVKLVSVLLGSFIFVSVRACVRAIRARHIQRDLSRTNTCTTPTNTVTFSTHANRWNKCSWPQTCELCTRECRSPRSGKQQQQQQQLSLSLARTNTDMYRILFHAFAGRTKRSHKAAAAAALWSIATSC